MMLSVELLIKTRRDMTIIGTSEPFYRYSLFSMVHYVGESYSKGNIGKLGHYNAHIRRSDRMWNVHDDLLDKVKIYKTSENIEIQPHILFYVKNKKK